MPSWTVLVWSRRVPRGSVPACRQLTCAAADMPVPPDAEGPPTVLDGISLVRRRGQYFASDHLLSTGMACSVVPYSCTRFGFEEVRRSRIDGAQKQDKYRDLLLKCTEGRAGGCNVCALHAAMLLSGGKAASCIRPRILPFPASNQDPRTCLQLWLPGWC